MRSAMRAASLLPERGPTDVDDAPAPTVINRAALQVTSESMCTNYWLTPQVKLAQEKSVVR